MHQQETLKATAVIDNNNKMEAVAKLNNHPTSPRKMRLVIDSIRGMKVEKALNTLKYTKKGVARDLEKLVLSAIANWEHKNEGARVEDSGLYIKEAFVNAGKTVRRFRPAPFGRAYRIRKRSNHVTIIVDSKQQAEEEVEA